MRRWAVVAVAALPCFAGAQTVRGTVTERTSQGPLVGAVVFLLDAAQTVVARDLTTEAGSYRLTAPRSGVYRVRTMRIGFRPVTSAPIQLAAGQDMTLPLVIETVPVVLSAVRVEQRSNCPARADVTPAYNAWNEVATALNAALLSSRLRGTMATIVTYDRWTAAGSDVVLRQGANIRTGMPGMPWRSISADSLHRAGFVVKEANGWYTFHAPDLDVLLSDRFLEDHCLQLGSVNNNEIAIEFTPARDRNRIAEIRGFVWLSTSTLELKRLQYRYVNVQREYEQGDAGGELAFLKLRNGNWIISRWQVRMPTAFKQGKSDSYGNFSGRGETRATEAKVTGGDLLRVVQNDDTLWAVPSRTFEGKVIDSATSRPIPGARIFVAGTTYSTVTNEFGRFSIADVLPGAYQVRIHTPDLDSLGTFHQTPVLFVEQLPNVEVRVPNRAQLLGRWCPAAQRADREASGLTSLLVGLVRNQRDSTPISSAEIGVEWQDAVMGQVGAVVTARAIKAETDADGMYRACGAPADHRLRVSTEFDGKLPPIETRIGPSRLRRLDIWVRDGQRVADSATQASIASRAPAQELKPVEVSAERMVLREFEERRAMGIGHFITRAELEKQENRSTGDVIARVPGARVARATSGGSAWIAAGRGPASGRMPSGDAFDQQRGAKPACYADIWVDDARVYTFRAGETLFDVNTIQPNQIEAMEFYSSNATIPGRYARGGTAQCGVLVIWTRR